MSLPQLRTFVEVYRQRSITAAARSLGLTQPAVSQHIATLEAGLERELFERHARGVTPTQAADELAAGIGDSLDIAEAALSSARARSTDMSGAVRLIGNGDFLAEVIAPRLLPLLRSGMRVRLQAGDRDETRAGLLDGHHDLGLLGYAVQDKRLRGRLIHQERLHAVASPAVASRIAAAPDLARALMAEPMLAYNLERPLVDDWLTANRLGTKTPAPALIGQDLRCLRGMMEQGFGWTVLPGYLCARQIAQGSLAEIPAPVALPVHDYFLAWLPSALRHPRIAFAHHALVEGFDEQPQPIAVRPG